MGTEHKKQTRFNNSALDIAHALHSTQEYPSFIYSFSLCLAYAIFFSLLNPQCCYRSFCCWHNSFFFSLLPLFVLFVYSYTILHPVCAIFMPGKHNYCLTIWNKNTTIQQNKKSVNGINRDRTEPKHNPPHSCNSYTWRIDNFLFLIWYWFLVSMLFAWEYLLSKKPSCDH